MKKKILRSALPAAGLLAMLALGAGAAGADTLASDFSAGTAVRFLACAVGVATTPYGWGLALVLLNCGLLMETP